MNAEGMCKHNVLVETCRHVKFKHGDHLAYVSALNFYGVGEFIAQYPDGDASSAFIRDYEPTCNTWKNIEEMLTP